MRMRPVPNRIIDQKPANGPVITSYISKEEAAAIVPQAIPRNHKKPIVPTFKKRTNTTKIHQIKVMPLYFELVKSGVKTFEVRMNDRNYQVGDTLELQEYNSEYTGRVVRVQVSYVLEHPDYTLPGMVIMAIRLQADAAM